MKIKVLLVDDEQEFIDYMAKRLKARGMDVEVAYEAESALRFVQHNECHVIVLDVLMPGMDGFETLRALKQLRADVPVIMLSGHGTIDAAEEGKKSGAVEYLLKPCDIRTLTEAIRRRAQPDAASPESG